MEDAVEGVITGLPEEFPGSSKSGATKATAALLFRDGKTVIGSGSFDPIDK